MYDFGYFDPEPVVNSGISGTTIWVIVSIVVAIIGGMVLYFVYIKPDVKCENKYLKWFKNFFNFKNMLIEDLLKVLYIVLAIYITFTSFALIPTNFVSFLFTLVIGNIALRLVFESMLVLIMIWKNTDELTKKNSKK